MELETRLQDRQQWSIGDACSMSRVLELLSTKTTFQVVRELFFGTTRFEDFVHRIGTSAPADRSRRGPVADVHGVGAVGRQTPSGGTTARVVCRSRYRPNPRRVRDH